MNDVVASQLGDKRELSEKLPNSPTAGVAAAVEQELSQGSCYSSYETENYLCYVWCESGQFKAEVWTQGRPQEVVTAASLAAVREDVEFFFGGDD